MIAEGQINVSSGNIHDPPVSNSRTDDRSEYDPAFLDEAGLDEGDLAIELLESVSEAILTIDTDSRILYANPAVERILGYTPRELVGQSKLSIIPPRLRTAHETGLRSYIETGEKHIDWDGIELPALHKDGHEIPALISLRELHVDGDRYFTGIIRDLSDRKEAERRVEEGERRIRVLHETIEAMETCGSVDDVHETLVDGVETILGADVTAIDTVHDGTAVTQAVVTAHDAPESAVVADGARPIADVPRTITDASRTGSATLVSDRGPARGTTPEAESTPDVTFRSVVAAPVGDHDVVWAATGRPDAFDATDRRTVALLATHAATVIDRLPAE